MQRKGFGSLPYVINAAGLALILAALCTALFLTRGAPLASAVLLGLPCACALGICALRIDQATKKRKNSAREQRYRRERILEAISLRAPRCVLSTAVPILEEAYALEELRYADGIALAIREESLFAIAALPAPPGTAPQADRLISCHDAAAKKKATRLVIVSNAAAGPLEALAARLRKPEVVWMDPHALAALPGNWPEEKNRAEKPRFLHSLLSASRVRPLWRYGALMILLYIFFRHALFLVFGLICLTLSIVARIRRAREENREARPFDPYL